MASLSLDLSGSAKPIKPSSTPIKIPSFYRSFKLKVKPTAVVDIPLR